ncbi:hypothetical protein AB6D34_09475 [Pectobacterium brasiliense]|uniref:Phage tail protein C-terminal domain-containing protein n=1 Tax=Pectobacterium brasiliense TaxID=180957 RepID=A0A3S0XWP8_9GAMM|nr:MULTISPECIES: hypothetical protein [Pectobacterium]GKW27758.1 hypothetical protein PEC331060_09360 [Pectobacterium carotovorum subsp. carotovorum]MBN3046498.1 hypothetical protein [Pectobacterium brasiliense]MBN3056751.1 hypothetical protein [Pectobacterium brasiliense]MBN3075369.1 hypothetical protein [Pectobacterium brasiliense]MBN3083505.1 hypothetical protein [Pectobacterium brasiliense]
MSEITPNDLPPINELDEFTSHIPELQIDTDVLAGTDGPANFQAQALANRTKYLKRILDAVSLELNGINQAVAAAQQVADTAKQGADASMKKAANGSDIVNSAAFRANIGLSNAMLRGEFGWGGKAVRIPDGASLTAFFDINRAAGLYWATLNVDGRPDGYTDVIYYWSPIQYADFYGTLSAIGFTAGGIKTASRNVVNSTWGDWVYNWDNKNLNPVTVDTAQTLTGMKVFRQNWESIGIVNELLGQPGYFTGRDFDGALRWTIGYETPDADYFSLRNNKASTVILFHSNRNIYVDCLDFIINNNTVWTSGNTAVDANGFIKVASPVVKLFSAGTSELNTESEGITTERIEQGVYRISGCLGLNSDLAWGGVDGGIVGPYCRNGLERLWIDYDVEPDGSIVIRTYHRTHSSAMTFARNELEGYEEGDPIDIPTDTFLSVRVQMPEREEAPYVSSIPPAPAK